MASRYRALLIGNSTYPADEHNLQTLKGPVKDIAVLNRALADQTTGLFADADVTLLPETTSARAIRALGKFFGEAHRDDVLLVYFSGHGKLDQSGRLHLCMQDTETADLLSTAVSSARINEFADASHARNIVIVLDCCYSGAFRGGDLGDAVAGPGRYVLTSCRGTQLANDATVENSTSHFTQHLVDGLLCAAVDNDGDGYVTFSDLYAYVDRQLRETGKQIPQRRVDGDGDLHLAKRPQQRPAVASVPAVHPQLAAQPAEGSPPGPGAAPAEPPRPGSPRRKAVLAALAAAVVAGGAVIALVLTRGGPGGNSPAGGGGYTSPAAFTATSPWRLKIEYGGAVGDGCSLSLIDARTGAQVRHLADGLYGTSTFQINNTGAFRWRVNDPTCTVVAQPGTGMVKLPFAIDQTGAGDSAVFAAPATVAVQVTDWQGDPSCDFALYDPASGSKLDFGTATRGQNATVSLNPGGHKNAYLGLDSCGVQVSAGR
jgi:caspase domain-containing protein